jgi:hypothetical protein
MRLFGKSKKNEAYPLYLYTEKDLETYERFITEQFGEYKEVFHEIVSPDIHLDIVIIPPTAQNNYYTLITMGMGAYKMRVPKKLAKYNLERAELVLCLPPTWNINSNKEDDYWPIRLLKVLARLPIHSDTWLGYGHTVSSDEGNTPYATNTGFCSCMLLNAINKNYESLNLILKGKGKINFYQLFPLYKEELEHKQETNVDTLLELFDDNDVTPVVDIERKNYGMVR